MTPLPDGHPLTGATADAPLIHALRGQRPATTPVWFMRQAGRSLPEYRAAREGTAMLDACLDPALAAELTLQPVRRHGVDAGIFFSDIVVPLRLAGVGVDIRPGVGPVMSSAFRTSTDIAQLTRLSLTSEALDPIREAVARTVTQLGPVPLIGFAGAPFTLAAYLVEGGPSRDHLAARTLMHADPAAWQALTSWTAEVTGQFLRAQINAGASAGQLFDSWAGALSVADYRDHVAAASTQALSHVADLDVPVVHFGTGTGHLLGAMRDAATAAGIMHVTLGVDYRTPLDQAVRVLGDSIPVQGNIDPALLAAPWDVVATHVRDVLRRGRTACSHVANLGHGVPPHTDPDVLTRVVELIHREES